MTLIKLKPQVTPVQIKPNLSRNSLEVRGAEIPRLLATTHEIFKQPPVCLLTKQALIGGLRHIFCSVIRGALGMRRVRSAGSG